jgi:uncharacterized protein (TIGR02302 family)
MPDGPKIKPDRTFLALTGAIRRARLALLWEDLWPRVAPILWLIGLYVALSWLGVWRIGGDWLRLALLAALGLALFVSLVRLAKLRGPSRLEAMRRVERVSGLPHRPTIGLGDRISPVADDAAAKALWMANQRQLYASLMNLRVGVPRPGLQGRDPRALRFAVPLLLALAFAVGWGEWDVRLGEAFARMTPAAPPIASRLDAWIDPPAYTKQPPVFLSHRDPAASAEAVSVPEGSRLTVRVVSADPAKVTVAAGASQVELAPKEESRAAGAADAIRSYETVLDRDSVITVAEGHDTTTYQVGVVEDHPPSVARGPMTVNRSGSFSLAFNIADDYGVTEGSVTFRPAAPSESGARPLVEPPVLPMRLDRAKARDGVARADGRLESHPYAGLPVLADAVVKDAAGQEGRPADSGEMVLPSRPFRNPLSRALVEQRRNLAVDANHRDDVASALNALTVAPEQIASASIYLGLRVGYDRLRAATSDDELRGMLDYLWTLAIAVEDGDVADAEQRLAAARKALEDALKNGASDEEISRLTKELRQALQDFVQSYASRMAEQGQKNQGSPSDPNAQTLTSQDLQKMLDRIENLAKLGNRDAAQELLSELQDMLDNLQMAQPNGQQPGDAQAMKEMNELADIMRQQQQLMDDTFQLNQGRRPKNRKPGSQEGADRTDTPPSAEEMAEMMKELQKGQGDLQQRLKQLLQQLQKGQGQENADSQDGQGGQEGQQQGSQPSDNQGPGQGAGQGGRALGRAGRAMGDASRSLGQGQPSDAYGHQGEALDALRQGLKGMMQQMYANGQGQRGRQAGGQNGSDRDPLGRPRRRQGPDLGEDVKVPDEVDVERARQILEAIRGRLGERSRPRYELDYLERLLRELQ